MGRLVATPQFSFFLLFWGDAKNGLYFHIISKMASPLFLNYMLLYCSHRYEIVSCECEGLKNIVISRSSIKVYNIYVINNHSYSILK